MVEGRARRGTVVRGVYFAAGAARVPQTRHPAKNRATRRTCSHRDSASRTLLLGFACGKGIFRQIDHFMASGVEGSSIGLLRLGWVEREEEHTPHCAESLLLAWRVPTRAEAVRRKHDELATGFCNGVSTGLFKGAHGAPSKAWLNL